MAIPRLPSLRPAVMLGVVLLSLPLAACASGNGEESPQTSVTDEADADAAAGVTVTAEDKGVMMLRLDSPSPASESQERLEGRLISGPGACLAVQPNGRPELLLFDQEAGFATNPPRVSWGESDVTVGEQFSVAATEVRVEDVQGVPERCARGAADTAWVIDTP